MRIDALYPYIVPLTFLAIWALTSLFNREAQPLPPRPGRPLGPPGPMPSGGSFAPRGQEPRPEFPLRGSQTARPRPPASTGVRGGLNDKDDVLIISAEPRRPSSPRTPAAGQRRGGKPRPVSSAGLQRVEAPQGRTLTETLEGSAPGPIGQPERLSPLTLPPSPLSAPSTLEGTSITDGRSAPSRPLSGDEIRKLLRTPQRLRETIILTAVLGPPLAARRGPFAKR